MKNQLTNPYWAILLVPLAFFLLLIHLRVDPDSINLWTRFYTFAMLGYVGARYVGRAPVLMWQKNMTPEARNVIGWAVVIVGFMLNIAYGWVYIAYDRPAWLSSQYWGVSFISLIALGISVVASSVPRLPPFGGGKNGLSELASAMVALGVGISVFAASHIPQIMAFFKALFAPVTHAL